MKTLLYFSFLISFWCVQAVAAPAALTYQGRILKSTGVPLEYSSVSFLFQIVSPGGTCVLYQEQVDGYDMTGSGGVFDTAIGNGTRQFPAAGVFTVIDALNNTNVLNCQDATTYTPAATDGRILRVQFHDGTGWKSITPDNTIRSVPYAGYASSAATLGTNVAGDFVLKTGIPTCAAGTYLSWDGTALNCLPVAGGAGGTVTDVSSANSYITVATTTTTPVMTLHVGTAANTVAAGDDTRIVNAFQQSQLPASCAADKTLTFASPSGAFTCSSIAITGAQVSGNIAGNAANFTGSLVGDVSGTQGATSVDKIKGVGLDMTGIASGNFLKYDGTNWVPSAPPAGNAGTVTGVTSVNSYLSVANGTNAAALTLNVGAVANTVAAGNDTRIVNAIQNAGGAVSIQSGLDAALGAAGTAGRIYFATDAQKIYRDNGGSWDIIASVDAPSGGGGLSSVTSANTDIGVAATTTAPVLTLNTGTGNNQIVKLDGSAKLPAVDGSALTNLTPANLSAVVPVAKGGTGQSSYTDGQILVGNTTGNTLAKQSLSGDATMTNAGVVTVAGVKGKSVSAAPTVTGQVLRYDGTDWTPAMVGMQDLRSNVTGTTALAATCGADKTLTYNSAMDNLTCTTIAIAGTQVTGNIAGNAANFTGSLVGDVSGTQGATSVDKIKGVGLDMTGIASGNYLKYDGTNWIPAAPPAGNAGTVTGVTSVNSYLSVANGTNAAALTLNVGAVANTVAAGNDTRIVNAIQNAGGSVSIQSGLDAAKGAASAAGRIFIATDTQKIYRDNGTTLDVVASVASGTGVTSVTSANTDIGVATTTTTPVLTLNTGTGNDQIVKLDGSAKLPAVDGSALTNLTPANLSTVVPVAKGGTGQSTYTNGQLLIGNTTGNTLTKATLTAGTGITITNGTGSITIDSTGLANSLADGKIWVGQTGTPTAVTPSGDVSMTNAGVMTVNAVKGKTVTAAPTVTGQVLRYNGTSWAPAMLGMQDLRSNTTGTTALASTCGADQTLTYNSAMDNLTCTNIGIAASQVTSGTLAVANGGTGTATGSITGTTALTFTAGGSNQNITLTPTGTGYTILNGKVGIGTPTPGTTLSVNGVATATSLVLSGTTATDGAGCSPVGSIARDTNGDLFLCK